MSLRVQCLSVNQGRKIGAIGSSEMAHRTAEQEGQRFGMAAKRRHGRMTDDCMDNE